MAKTVTVCCDNGAHARSCRKQEVEVDDIGFTDEEWEALSDNEKQNAVVDWVNSQGWVEIWGENL